MGKALEIIAGRTTAAGATLTALTMNTGNTLQIRNCPPDANIRLLTAWTKEQAAGIFRIRSPRLHDNVQGIRWSNGIADVVPLMWNEAPQPLISQDTLIAELSGSAVAGDIDCAAMLIQYDNLPGVDARLISPDELNARAIEIVNVENTINALASGDWTGEEAINAEFDLLKANEDYALVGFVVSGNVCNAIRWRGADTGNLGVGGPGNLTNKFLSRNWFVALSYTFNLPLIPVFNSANKAAILIDCQQDENGLDPTVNSIFVRLAS